ncbi:MAG TPA: hypothetical protein VFE33_10425 [Thermoanaerobaculia bacterium]|nr:hypothetical protein [Thermoanaerobaculia bacterium]
MAPAPPSLLPHPTPTPAVDPPDDPKSLLLAAKALVFCGFPYQRNSLTTIVREAHLGADTHLTVYLSTTEPNVPTPYGADRALLAWITTLTYDTGFVTFTSLTDFFDAFRLARSGVQYRRFEERLHRLLSFSLSLILRTPGGVSRLNMRPLQRAYTPRDGVEARRLLAEETRSQLSLLPSDVKRYGILLDPAFLEYLRNNPVVLPLALMRRFHNRPLAWDAASYLLYRCWSARTPCVIPWKIVRRQLASVDQLDRRLALSLNRVADEIRADYPDFPVRIEPGSHDLLVAPFRPPREHFRV